MTDNQWSKIINKCYSKLHESMELLKIAEEEYVKRYGNYPSEVDDDWWIDTLHYGKGSTNLDKIKESAEIHKSR